MIKENKDFHCIYFTGSHVASLEDDGSFNWLAIELQENVTHWL